MAFKVKDKIVYERGDEIPAATTVEKKEAPVDDTAEKEDIPAKLPTSPNINNIADNTNAAVAETGTPVEDKKNKKDEIPVIVVDTISESDSKLEDTTVIPKADITLSVEETTEDTRMKLSDHLIVICLPSGLIGAGAVSLITDKFQAIAAGAGVTISAVYAVLNMLTNKGEGESQDNIKTEIPNEEEMTESPVSYEDQVRTLQVAHKAAARKRHETSYSKENVKWNKLNNEAERIKGELDALRKEHRESS